MAHDVLDNGICVDCQPHDHVLEDGLCVTCRPMASRAHFDPSLHPHDPHSGEFVHTPGGSGHGGFLERLAEALTKQDALDATPAKLVRAPRGHYGDYNGEALHGPSGMGSVRALSEYEGVEYSVTNNFLRGGFKDPHTGKPDTGHEPHLEGVLERVAEIDKTMSASKLTSDVKVERVVKEGSKVWGRDVWYGDVIDQNEQNFDIQDQQMARWESGVRPDLTGLRWKEPAYSSTTADPAVAHEFGKGWLTANSPLDGEPVIMTILAPKGTGAVQLAELGHAAEILLERDLTYEVVADHGVGPDGFRLFDVQVVPA